MNTPKKRDYYFDNAKFMLILFVVVGHTIESVSKSDPFLRTMYITFYSFHVATFIFIAGYFAGKSKSAAKHAFSYIRLYVGAQLAYYAISKLLMEPSIELTFSDPYWTFWFLLAMAIWFLFTPMIKEIKWALPLSIAASVAVGFDDGFGILFSSSRAFVFLPFFIAGMSFDKSMILKLKKSYYRYPLYILSLAFIGYLYTHLVSVNPKWFFGYGSYASMGYNEWYAFIYRIFAYLITTLTGLTFLVLSPDSKTFFSVLGRYTLPVYLAHGVLIRLSKHYGYYDLVAKGYSPYWFILVATAFTLVVSWTFMWLDIQKGITLKQKIRKKGPDPQRLDFT